MENVRKWLDDQGYPLEMAVARAMLKGGFAVTQSTYFEDPETNKLRELDVSAQRHSDSSLPVLVQIGCCIECKSSPAKPWLIFRAQEQPSAIVPPLYSLGSAISKSLVASLFDRERFIDSLREFSKLDWFRPRSVGYSVTQAFTSGQDIPYQAVLGATKACMARFATIDNLNKMKEFRGPMTTMMFPVVVIDSPLFELSLDSSGQTTIEEIEHGMLEWHGTTNANSPAFLVHLYRRTALDQLVADMAKVADGLIEIHLRNMDLLQSIATLTS